MLRVIELMKKEMNVREKMIKREIEKNKKEKLRKKRKYILYR